MKRFCPTCDAMVDTPVADDRRCPRCHHTLEAALSEDPAKPRSSKPIVAIAALVVVAAGAIGFWQVRMARTAAAPPAEAGAPPTQDLAKLMLQAGLKGDGAVPPGTPDEALKKAGAAAKDAQGVAALLAAQKGPGKLQALAPSTRRSHLVENTAALWAQVQAGKAEAIHSIEAAFLAQALLQAAGAKTELVTETAGLQTPMLLSRTRLGVRVVGDKTIVEPLADQPMQQPQVVPQAQAAAWWLVLRAHSHRVRAEYAQTYLDLGAAAALAPEEPAVVFARGVADIDQGLADKGVPECEAALAKRDDALARLFLAEVAQALDQPVKALQRTEEVLKAHPDLAEALVAKAVLQLQRVATVPEEQKAQLVSEARTMLDKAVTLDAKVPGARAAQAQAALLQKDDAGAEKLLREAAQGGDLDAGLMLSDFLRKKGDNAGAVAVLQGLPQRLDDDRFVLALLTALMGNKESDKALEIANKAYAQSPSNPQIGLMRADLLRMSGRTQEAIDALEPLKKSAQGDKIALLQAQLLLQNHQADKAEAQLEAVVAKLPESRDANLLLLMAYAMAQHTDKAEALSKKAMAQKVLKPTEVAGVYLQSGDAEHAAKILEAVVQANPAEAEAVGTLAMVYTASGRKKDAETLRDKAVAAAGDKGPELKALVDKAITAAEGELKRMNEPPPAVNGAE